MDKNKCVQSVHAAGEQADFGRLQGAEVDDVEGREPGEEVEEDVQKEGEAGEEREA